MPARLLLDPPAGGAWNMAVDEALIEAAVESSPLVLRFYAWTPGTLSLGYFQQAAERMHHRPSLRCPLVRRASGGGAIVHDRELTYSLVVPAGHRLARETAGLYRALHGALAEALAEWGVVGEMFRCGVGCEVNSKVSVPHPSPLPQGEGARGAEGARVSNLNVGEGPGVRDGDAAKPVNPRATRDAFLCFQRRGEGDLVVGGAKIAGSAQRRRHGAVLQHGSVLLGRSEAAPELPGLEELAGQPIDADALRNRWLARLAAQLDLEFTPTTLTAAEREAAVELQRAKYSAAEWTYRR